MRETNRIQSAARQGLSLICALLLILIPSGAPVLAQTPAPPPPAQAPTQLLNANQLDDLVAPIALYPDPLLGQVLSAATYPLEVVEAQQWLQQNSALHGDALMNAAKEQNWDPSVQALVAFPDVLAQMTRDVQWTTDLGNAFLAQQSDVMAAIQRMRVRAQQNGRLSSNPQQTVTTQTQDGQSAVVIEPTNPQVIYVPQYNPVYVWGPPVWGYYPPLWYPPVAYGFGYYPGIYLSGFFPGWGIGVGWPGWGYGWGWGLGWFGGGVFVNNFFFGHYGYGGFYHGGAFGGGRYAWAHDPFHRAGVPYANGGVASRFNNARFAAGRMNTRAFTGTGSFASGGAARGFNGGNVAGRSFNGAGSAARGFNGGGAARGFAPSTRTNMGGANRSFAAPSSRGYAGSNFASRSYTPSRSFGGQSYSAPRSFGGQSYAAPRSFSGGGFSGRSFGGGGQSFGGGGGRSFGGGGGHFGGGAGGGGHFGGGGGGGHHR